MRILVLAFAVCLVLANPYRAHAEVVAGPIFGSGMVLQRDQAVPVWGTATPGEAVVVTFAGQKLEGKADAKGKWKVALTALKANATPAEMTITGEGKTLIFKDILVGEVWLCSGQSNMGWQLRQVINADEEVAAAKYPEIRAFTAGYASGDDNGYVIKPEGKIYALRPQEKCLGAWTTCTPEHAKNWSGVGYFFARHLHRELKVPVGIVISSMGATAIESWISLEGLKEIPNYRERALAFEEVANAYLADKNSFASTLDTQKKNLAEKYKKWFAMLDAEDPGIKEKWMLPAYDIAKWGAVKLPVTLADNPLGAPVASIWFRKDVTIPAEWVGKELTLSLGVIDGVDDSYVNGTPVGRTWFDAPSYWEASRVYKVPASATTTTSVSVVMRLCKTVYHLAPFGPAEKMSLGLSGNPAGDAPTVSLAGEWKMQKAKDLDSGKQPQLYPMPGGEPGKNYGHCGVQYNGLIHPIAPFAIRGAIWYQGEANAPFYMDYRSLMPGLINSWRKEWGYDFAFGIVQLADYFGEQTKPVERDGYTNLRESQAMALRVPGTFLATAVGVGEGKDIHPRRKQEVGRRLAMSAMGNVYGVKDKTYSGPTYKSMKIEGNTIRLTFDFARGLNAQGDPPVGFAIAGEDRTFYFATAKIEGESVIVSSEKVAKPIAVRYAWATNPVCNVYNDEKLPMFMFKTDSWDLSQIVIPKDEKITIPSGWVTK